MSKGKFHFYADDTVLYCSAPTADQALSQLQLDFNTLQQNLYDLKLVLNAEKTKVMLFSNLKSKSNLPSILTSQGTKIECVSKYRYLCILIDESLSFTFHIQQLAKRLKLKLGFYFRIKSCQRDWLLPLLCLYLTMVMFYTCMLRLKIYMHWTLYTMELWGSSLVLKSSLTIVICMNVLDGLLYQCGDFNTGISSYKDILGLLQSYLLTYISVNNIGTYNLRSQDLFLLSVPKVRTELGKKAFKYAAPSTWNKLQKSMKLNKLVSLVAFKRMLTDLEAATSGCRCFAWCVMDFGWL